MTKSAEVGDYVRFESDTFGWADPPAGTQWMKRGDILQIRKKNRNGHYYFANLIYPHPQFPGEEYTFLSFLFVLVKKQVTFDDIFNPTVKWVVDNESTE